jgi:hypothetical protein
MKDITVIVKPHHLKGNAWAHGAGENHMRGCPLYEALKEVGYQNVAVLNAVDVYIGDDKYEIEGGWSDTQVNPYIEAANQGSDTEYTLNLKFVAKEEGVEAEV